MPLRKTSPASSSRANSSCSDVTAVDRLRDDETFRRDTRLAGVDRARFHADRARILEVGAGHHDERIAPAKLEHALLDLTRRAARHLRSGAVAACQRDRLYPRIIDHTGGLFRLDEQALKRTVAEACFPQYL